MQAKSIRRIAPDRDCLLAGDVHAKTHRPVAGGRDRFRVDDVRLMASDGCDDKSKFDGFRLALTVPTESEAHKAFNALATGGSIQMPLCKTFWSPCYGMLTDKFRVGFLTMNNNVSPGILGVDTFTGTQKTNWYAKLYGANPGNSTPLREILSKLVQALIVDFKTAVKDFDLPEDYDPPAACLILLKRYDRAWQALRLGDSCLLARGSDGAHISVAASPNNAFDHWLSTEALKRRDAGMLDIKELLAEFRPQLMQGRKLRNSPGGYGILEASPSAKEFAEYFDLGAPGEILLCTDGYYRAVDHYALHSSESLLQASLAPGGVDSVLDSIRSIEADDPACMKYLRFKPADDATAITLRKFNY